MNYYFGLDLGTGSLKTVLFDANGKEIAVAEQEYPHYQPHNGWSEQEPEDWFKAVKRNISYIMNRVDIDKNDVKAIGLSGQMMGLILLDKNGDPLRRAILWNDGRTSKACGHVREIVSDELFEKYSLTPARPGLTAAKIQWVKDNEPEIFEKAEMLLLPKDYVRYRLTGNYATEVSDASATQLLDVVNRKWADEILDLMEIDKSRLPKVYESHEITGYVEKNLADELGLSHETIVVGGASDNAAAAIGVGVVKPGRTLTTIGTSGTVFSFSEKPILDKNRSVYCFCMTMPNTWHYMGSVNSAGGSLKWWRNTYYPDDKDYLEINKDLESTKPGSENLIFLPYLNGEQSPHFNLECRGSFVGLSTLNTKKDMTRAVFEGISYALNDIKNGIKNTGTPIDIIHMCGGGSKSEFWRQLLADVYDLPVALPDMNSENSAAFGAAMLGMVGYGQYKDLVEASDHILKMKDHVYTPNKENVEIYKKYYEEFRKLYPALKESYASILHL